MAAIPNYAGYKTLRENGNVYFDDGRASFAPLFSRINSLWVQGGGAAPTLPVVPTGLTTGSILHPDPGAGTQQWVTKAAAQCQNPCLFILCDRLSHQAGLSAIVTTAQTTNLPTAAITRTGLAPVMMGIDIYTQIGATATTVSVNYDTPTLTGQTSTLTPFGGTNNREQGRFLPISLGLCDSAVVEVNSVTVTATTGTAGNFGITLFRPLLTLKVTGGEICDPDFLLEKGHIPELKGGECLYWLINTPALLGATGEMQMAFGADER